MGLPREQLVSDLLHTIASLIQEADDYLCESSLSPTPFAKAGKKRPRPKLRPTPFNRQGKKHEKGKKMFSAIKRPRAKSGGLQPHKADGLTNRLRKMRERINKPSRDVFRAKRERKQRSRYQANKLTTTPRKVLGTRFRKR